VTERVDHWIRGVSHDRHRRWRSTSANQLLTAPTVPPIELLEPMVAPMQMLLAACADGAVLTAAGYLPKVLVQEMTTRFGWWEWDKPPHSQADVPQVGELREAATRLGLVRRRGKVLKTTTAGSTAMADSRAVWRAIVGTLGGGDPFGDFVAEVVTLRLLDGAVVGSDRFDELAPVVISAGWRTGSGPTTASHVENQIHRRLFWWRMLGLLAEESPRWMDGKPSGSYSTGFSDLGRATGIAFLHRRATAPKVNINA
jgi:hypothetical protein